jgi:haloacid dehalogenase superfamily, subfamily IA, variant 3 with third motif having DD or ED
MLVIFDCDGVLVDSESLAARVFSEHLANFNVALSAQECEEQFRGQTMDYCLNLLQQKFPGALPDDFLHSLALATTEAFGQDLQPVAGIESVLQWLAAQGTPFCVASNGALSKIRHSLEVTGLYSYFGDHRFSVEQVKQGKPAPDLFLMAAERMGFTPRETLVVEDSVAGVTAAIRAGMFVVRYGAPLELEGRKIDNFTDMAVLPEIIQRLAPNLRGD